MDTIITLAKDWGAILTTILAAVTLYRLLVKPMNDRFDRIESRLDKLAGRIEDVNSTLAARIEDVNSTLAARIEEVNSTLAGRIDHLAERIDQVNSALSSRIDKLADRVDQIADRLDGRIDKLADRLDGRMDQLFLAVKKAVEVTARDAAPSNLDMGGAGAPTEAQSPLVLSQLGVDIAERINAPAMVEKYAHWVKIPEDICELEIQILCFLFAREYLTVAADTEDRETLKKAIFEEGGYPNTVLDVFGILFRDHYLKKRGFDVPVRKPGLEPKPPPPPSVERLG